MPEERTIEAYAVTDANITYRTRSFWGIPIIIVIGWIKTKYVSIFSVEHEEHRLVVLYNGICPVARDDRLRIIGDMDHGKNVGISGMVMVAYRIENLNTGDIYQNY
ncbi:hypothetical protein [Methanolobus profundi]|uniref:Uncharacterized protein n=1 Tax=Methanolobus profundi TaxID=487685 RepID=A0A1I4NYI4_9EURY|nr:hypothetical protein [Methanolobus profundi]SFM20370.1 hypothetical protein SAMN04488696_0331 [Methanolobus profundi]